MESDRVMLRTPNPHKHEWIEEPLSKNTKRFRCAQCGSLAADGDKSETEQFMQRVTDVVIADIEARGPISEAIKKLLND